MAYENLSAVLPVPAAHPLAKPGYGKRVVPDQRAPRPGDFAHLSVREAYLASLLDQLCENAAMDAKTIAKSQPLYGQQAVRSAFNELGRAGHLRRVRRRVESVEGPVVGTRWVFHTYWSRTARDNEWWARFLDGDTAAEAAEAAEAPQAPQAPQAAPPQPEGHDVRQPSAAYLALARIGLQEARLALSSADCAALEELAATWLARGVTPDHLIRVLVAGLPEHVHSPPAFVRRRLVDKLPPERPAAAEAPAPRTLMECTDCGVPGRPEALPGGLCGGCRAGGGAAPVALTGTRPATVRARVADIRTAMRDGEREPQRT
ncbi:hypothetical protein ACWD0J_28210 [Streptomyces sp. NPDC003011]